MAVTVYQTWSDSRWEPVDVKTIIFPGGEPHVEVSNLGLNGLLTIDARVASMDDFMLIPVLAAALREFRPRSLDLFIPYFPGARQDRQEEGFALTVKVFADIINDLYFDTVTIVDPHSSVTPALLDNVTVMDHQPAVSKFLTKHRIHGLICPDEGAIKRVQSQASYMAYPPFPIVYARKQRDPRTGKLSGFDVDPITFSGNWCVVDDICDGGGTFIGMADEIAKKNGINDHQAKLFLWTTHGIYSKGVDGLHKAGYYAIGCTDSFPNDRIVNTIPLRGASE